MSDTTIKIGKSLIQHGTENDRIYIMKLHEDDMPQLIDTMDDLAKDKNYSKIVAKIPCDFKKAFENKGFEEEGLVPNFYFGEKTAYFMSKFKSGERKTEHNFDELEDVQKVALNKKECEIPSLKEGFICRKTIMEDAKDMVDLYKKVFETYPFPIYDPEYLIKTMEENIVYFGIWDKNELIALSSCEMDEASQNVEMTDFAVNPVCRGSNLSIFLLSEMEEEMKKRSMQMLYTIARAKSYGMNATFSKMGYTFSGRLKNNTNICGDIESMNIWYKKL